MLDKWLQDKKQISLTEAKSLVDRGGSVLWRPDPSLAEENQYALVLHDPEIGN